MEPAGGGGQRALVGYGQQQPEVAQVEVGGWSAHPMKLAHTSHQINSLS
jgi:hypothetical protein